MSDDPDKPGRLPDPKPPSDEAMRALFANAGQTLRGAKLAQEKTEDLPKVSTGGGFV
jgi:hypothetical protein